MAVSRMTQLLRVGVGSAALVSIPAITHSFTVHAMGNEPEGTMVNIRELSVYDDPEERFQYRYVPEEINPLRQVISEARQSVWEYLETIQETTDKVKDKIEVGKTHAEAERDSYSLLDYIQNDPGMLPRVAVITVAGLGGIVAGYRGGVARKLFFSTTAVAVATSLCYPKEAVALTTDAYNATAESIKSLWTAASSGENSKVPKVKQESNPVAADSKMTTPAKGRNIKGDPGQSKDEDKDLYTTRGS